MTISDHDRARLDQLRQAVDALEPSTTWTWRRVKLRRPAGGQGDSAADRRHPSALRKRNPREPLQVRVVYRGGPEAWWELSARGVTIRRPGSCALHDVLSLFDGSR